MPKKELEFFRPDQLPWTPVAGSARAGAGGPGIEEKVLSRDPDTGDVTRLLRFAPGVRTADTIAHDFWEEVLIVEGSRPPGMRHGPYASPQGALLFETRYQR